MLCSQFLFRFLIANASVVKAAAKSAALQERPPARYWRYVFFVKQPAGGAQV
jgi:hypothetical protein